MPACARFNTTADPLVCLTPSPPLVNTYAWHHLQVLLATVSLVAYVAWMSSHESQLHYLCYDHRNSRNAFYRVCD
jgi:hypothetical protein